jgi:PAS domain S-box-containing protein
MSIARLRHEDIFRFCLFELAFYFAYQFGMAFSHACASPFWFPDSVLLCALLFYPSRRWWIFLLAPLPIRLFAPVAADIPWEFLLAAFAIDSAKGVLMAAALRRLVSNPIRITTIREVGIYCLVTVLLVPTIAAFAGATLRHLRGYPYWPAWEQWFMGNALTHLIVTPCLLYLLGIAHQWHRPSLKRFIEATTLAAGLAVTAYMAFDVSSVRIGFAETRFYAPVPFLFWAAVRFGMLGASGAITIVSLVAVGAALDGRGLFADSSPSETALALQHFLLSRVAPLYLVATLVEQKNSGDRALRESEERFRHLADTAPVLIWMSGVDKGGTFFNQAWLDLTGRTLEQEMGSGWAEAIHPDDRSHCLQRYESAFDLRQPFEAEYRLRRHDGQYRWVLDRGVARYAGDRTFLGYIGSTIDITDRKNAEAEAHRHRTELAHASRVSTMGQLASALAHELSQPLGAILQNVEASELFLDRTPPDYSEIHEILSDIRQDSRRAAAVIDRMRSLLQRRDLEFEDISLNQLLPQVISLTRGEMMARHVMLEVNLQAGLPIIKGDRIHLQQVMLNLLVNGADAMHGLPSKKQRLEVRANLEGHQTVLVSVSDTGPGLPADKLVHLFEPFYTTKPNGMGMGLAISQRIVECHGGRIWAENNREGGASFRFTLPVPDRETN